MTKTKSEIYKEFKYPNGKVLRLTKEEFMAIVEYFALLARHRDRLEAEGKLKGDDWIEVDEELLKAIREYGSTGIVKNLAKRNQNDFRPKRTLNSLRLRK